MGTGRLRRLRPTIVAVALSGILILTVWLVSLNMHSDEPTTLDGVTHEVEAGVDAIEDLLPPTAIVKSADQSDVSECLEGGGEQVELARTITLQPGFDRFAWIEKLTTHFEAKGSVVSSKAVGSNDHVSLKIVGPPLLIYTVGFNAESDHPNLTIRSTSRCTVPAED